MNIKRTILIGITALCSLSSVAQRTSIVSDETFADAQKQYDNGEFANCEKTALRCAEDGKGMVRTSAYRLLALCRLACGDLNGAGKYVDMLLKTDPYFSPSLGDPQRFIDIINENKSKEAGITTASRQSESLDEAPVPVTLITDDMIQLSGASTLQELLCLYVPGMTMAEGMETNIAMHGIYSLTQDKILFMVDGHRLNSSSTNAEAPDYRSSLDKIQQIEVLRGPASSLYGNVALTAVVNIITRKGAALNGGRITGMTGTQKAIGGSFLVGGGNNVVDIMGWGGINYMKGFEHQTTNINGTTNTMYVGGFRGRPSYDIGMKGRWKDFTLSLNIQRSKRVPYINVLQVPADQSLKQTLGVPGQVVHVVPAGIDVNSYKNYNYDSYEEIGGEGPGASRSNNRINLDYSHSFGKFDIQASGYISMEKTSLYNVLGDSIDNSTGTMLLRVLADVQEDDKQSNIYHRAITKMLTNPISRGAFQKMDWSGVTYGFQAQALTNYNLLGTGSLIFGAQYEQFSLSNGDLIVGGNYTAAAAMMSTAIFKNGSETSLSTYAQIKHFFTPSLIFNAGIRYDNKKRFSDHVVERFSPRFSIIYKITKNIALRGNYNYSFVDAPYIFRACIIPLFGGGSNMKPESMHSFNVGTSYYNPQKHLSMEIGSFYNILNDLCITNLMGGGNSKFVFINAGKVRSFGIDAALQYTKPRFFLNANSTWQRILTSEKYIVHNSQTFSTPEFYTNTVIGVSPYHGSGTGFFNGGKLWLRGTLHFQTKTYYKSLDLLSTIITARFSKSTKDISIINEVNPQCIAGIGVSYNWKHLDIDLTMNNIFNNEFKIGSMLIDGIPHPGRHIYGKVTYKF